MFDLVDALAGAAIGVVLVSLLPNRLTMWTWKPKTKWGKRRQRARLRAKARRQG